MKKFIIWYIVFSVLMFFALYTFTLYQGANKRTVAYFDELIKETVSSNNPDTFIKYQSYAFQRIAHYDTSGYTITTYHVLIGNQIEQENHFLIFVIPQNESIHYATRVDDLNDQTKLLIKEGSLVKYDSSITKPYQGHAISYGVHLLGMYYYDIKLEENLSGHYQLFDYQNQLINETEITVNITDYLSSETNFQLGFTQQEKDELLAINRYVRDELITNITWFLVVDIVVGGMMWFILKRIAHQKD